jgi:hypothetical protein
VEGKIVANFDVRRLVRQFSPGFVDDQQGSRGPDCELVLLANRWIVMAPQGHIDSIRVHLYTGQGERNDMIAFLQERSLIDWRVARRFVPPEIRFDRLAVDEPGSYPPAPPVSANLRCFFTNPELMVGDAMTEAMLELPDSFFLELPRSLICCTSALLRSRDDEVRLLDPCEHLFPRPFAKARITTPW